jgi:hypothetical protein
VSDLPVIPDAYNGWRAWTVDLRGLDGPQLRPLWNADQQEWPAGKRAEATCTRQRDWRPWHGRRAPLLHDPDLVPADTCTCGFVCVPDPASAIEYLEDWEHWIRRSHRQRQRPMLASRFGTTRPLPAFGRVSMWGEAVEHGSALREAQGVRRISGVRTRYAYPQELWLPGAWWDAVEVDAQLVASQLADRYLIPVQPIEDLADIELVWRLTDG